MRRKKHLLVGAAVLLVALMILLAVVLRNNGTTGASLAGTWRIDDTTVYEFDGKGNGVMHTSLSEYAFTYTVEGSTLTIDFANEAATDTAYQYSIKGKTLTLKRGGEVYELKKE